MRLFLLLLISFICAFAECNFEFISPKTYVKVRDYESDCKGKYFVRLCQNIDLLFCVDDIREECKSLVGNDADDQCNISNEDPYSSSISSGKMNEILYHLSQKGWVYISKKDSTIKSLFVAKYYMQCSSQGIDGGETGNGVFYSDECVFFRRNVSPTW